MCCRQINNNCKFEIEIEPDPLLQRIAFNESFARTYYPPCNPVPVVCGFNTNNCNNFYRRRHHHHHNRHRHHRNHHNKNNNCCDDDDNYDPSLDLNNYLSETDKYYEKSKMFCEFGQPCEQRDRYFNVVRPCNICFASPCCCFVTTPQCVPVIPLMPPPQPFLNNMMPVDQLIRGPSAPSLCGNYGCAAPSPGNFLFFE